MKKILCLILPVLLLVASCEYQSYSDYKLNAYDGAFEWTEVCPKADWSNRLDHAALWFDGRLWVMGGYNPGKVKGDPYMEDVWSSADGENWRLETEAAPWLGRRGHAAVVFDDGDGEAMYLIGGFTVNEENGYREYRNDVWRSQDGRNWEELKSREEPPLDSLYDWYPRFKHRCVVAEHDGLSYIYLVGGVCMLDSLNIRYSMKYFSDVWRSQDAINWERLPNTDFGFRAGHALSVDPQSQDLYLHGGRHGEIFNTEGNASHPHPQFHWLWHSEDGITWTAENDTAEFNQDLMWRSDHGMAWINSSLFSFPGRNSSTHHIGFSSSFWRYDTDSTWTVDSEGSDFNRRYGFALVVNEEEVWILGGETDRSGPDNDVWHGEIK